MKRETGKMTGSVAAFGALLLAAGPAGAADYYLCADTTTKTMPDTTVVTMWGFAMDDDADLSNGCGGTATVPGPPLTVPAGDNTLTINLRNDLAEAVSLVIPGQQAALAPVFVNDAQGRPRVHSFTHETAPAATGAYTWSDLKAGTYLYQSGTHPAVQVQMGLYGAVVHDAGSGEAYTGVPYDNEVTLLYSEIDPALHDAVAGGSYGTAAYPSTINYVPSYFLVNGAPYVAGDPALSAGAAGERTLLRFLNAGLQDHAMILQGSHMTLVAEDGNAYPWPHEQYSVFLAAGKTKDAIFIPAATGDYAVYDRRLRLTNAPNEAGGMLAFLTVGAAVPGPTAVDDPATTAGATIAEDTPVTTIAVLANDIPAAFPIDPATVAIGTPAVHGLASENPDGTVDYSPNPDFSGGDSFTYTVRDISGNLSNAATVSLSITPVNDPPVALDDGFTADQDSSGNVLDVLANDGDVDGDALTITAVGTPDSGGSATTDGSTISYSPLAGFTGDEAFTYDIGDGNGGSATATITVTVSAVVNQAPVAVDDYDTVTRNSGASSNSVTIDVAANDTDADGTVVPASVLITVSPKKGTAQNNGDGTITYTPAPGKRGADTIGYTIEDNQGAVSNEATVRVDILR